MRILGIESSCDETAVAIVVAKDGGFVIEKNLVASQADLHSKYGGVVPEIAARLHTEVIVPLLRESGVPTDGEGIDAIAVTAGPGLSPALRVGVEAAKALSWVWDKPVVAVNHLEGHVYSAWLKENENKKELLLTPNSQLPTPNNQPSFPALCLLVSGGHTELVLMRDFGQYELVGETRDDAVGEAFDKVAKLLGLSYPGGPEISCLAEQGNSEAIDFPRPMLRSGDFDFSYSGLKTAVRVYLNKNSDADKADVAASFQAAAVDVLIQKTMKAAKEHFPKSIILAGGVAANNKLRTDLAEAIKKQNSEITFHPSDRSFTGDNAAMIAVAGHFRSQAKEFTDPVLMQADPNMRLAD